MKEKNEREEKNRSKRQKEKIEKERKGLLTNNYPVSIILNDHLILETSHSRPTHPTGHCHPKERSYLQSTQPETILQIGWRLTPFL